MVCAEGVTLFYGNSQRNEKQGHTKLRLEQGAISTRTPHQSVQGSVLQLVAFREQAPR